MARVGNSSSNRGPARRPVVRPWPGCFELKPVQPLIERVGRAGPSRPAAPALSVLIVTDNPLVVARVRRAAGRGALCVLARTYDEALSITGEAPGDLAVIDADALGDATLELAERLAAHGPSVALTARRPTTRLARRARASGCRSVFAHGLRVLEIRARLLRAADQAGGPAARTRGRRGLRSLDRLCRRDRAPRTDTARQQPPDCTDLVHATTECMANMNQVTTANEFTSLIRHELDIEQLLRSTLEFVLARSGPTNAAVFLPTTSGDYSLGAYVNYDCPKETVDILLDHIANTVAPKFEPSEKLVHLTTDESLRRFVGEDAAWLGDSGVVGMSCRHEGEVLAIVMLFRDRASPFGPLLLDQLRMIGEVFAAQLARVIHIHHRHLPKEKWGCIGDPPKDDGDDDLAA